MNNNQNCQPSSFSKEKKYSSVRSTGKKRKLVIYPEFNRTEKGFLTNHCTSSYILVEKFAGEPPQPGDTRWGHREDPGGDQGGWQQGADPELWAPREQQDSPGNRESSMGLLSLKSH